MYLNYLQASAAQLLQRGPHAVPAIRGEHIIQQVVHQEFCLLQQLGYELAIITPTELICQLRCTQRRQLQRGPIHKEREETVTVALAFVAYQLATAHIDLFPFSVTSEASQVGMGAWFVSALLYRWLCKMSGH